MESREKHMDRGGEEEAHRSCHLLSRLEAWKVDLPLALAGNPPALSSRKTENKGAH